MKTKNSLLLALGLFGLTATTLKAQIAINNSAANPDASAILDLKSGNAGVNKGFLPQSVALTNVTVAAPVVAPATGLIVYSSTAPVGGNGAGYYFWNGTAWASMNSSASSLSGSGINNYVARWTPNATTLGTGMIQDNGSTVGVNIAPQLFSTLYSYATTGTAFIGWTTDGTQHGVAAYNSGTNGVGLYGAGESYSVYGDATYYPGGSGGYFTDGTDYATTADVTNANGVTAYGTNFGVYGLSVANVYGAAGVYGRDDGFAGVIGVTTYANGGGVAGYDSTTGGIGVYAYGGSYGNYSYGATAGGYFYDATGDNSYQASGGYGTNSFGTFYGGYFSDPNGDYAYTADNIGVGVFASGISDGVYGITTAGGFNAGVYGQNTYASSGVGMGIYGECSGAGGYYFPGTGPGVLGDGTSYGVMGIADTTSGVGAGGYFTSAFGGAYAFVGYYDGTTNWKITGAGSLGTVVRNTKNELKAMVAPEAPEILFEDYGTGSLAGGKIHINLDPTYAKNVTINEKHPLRVLITLNDADCNGVAVINRTSTGFDVVELAHGTSNAAFTYEVIANRADEYDANGKLVSKNADIRFTKGAEPIKIAKAEAPKQSKNTMQNGQKEMTANALANPKQNHKGTVVKLPTPIKNASGPKDNIGQSNNTQPNTQK